MYLNQQEKIWQTPQQEHFDSTGLMLLVVTCENTNLVWASSLPSLWRCFEQTSLSQWTRRRATRPASQHFSITKNGEQDVFYSSTQMDITIYQVKTIHIPAITVSSQLLTVLLCLLYLASVCCISSESGWTSRNFSSQIQTVLRILYSQPQPPQGGLNISH